MGGFGEASRIIGLSPWRISRRTRWSEEGDALLGGPMLFKRHGKPSFLMVRSDRGTEFADHNTIAKARLTFAESGRPHDLGKS